MDALRLHLPGLRARYAEPQRAYHTQAHIEAMLTGLHALGPAVTAPDILELAIWYHDAIYDPAAGDNEARSAALLHDELTDSVDPAALAQAEDLIRWTADHRLPPDLPPARHADAALFLDLDLAILGAAPARYDDYERGIAAEYLPVVGPDRFRAGRAAFLQATLQRPRLFHTERFTRQYDPPARSNMRRALATLGEGGPRS